MLGISSFFLWFFGIITAILAIIFGAIARKEIRESNGRLKGMGMATWGFWLGLLPLIIGGIIVFAAVVFVLVSDLGNETANGASAILGL